MRGSPAGPPARGRPVSLGVAGRLALLLCGLAGVSTGVALVLQDRALDQDLRRQARTRLKTSAEAADRLIADHLRGLVTRYAAISRTPELRANLDTRHAPTLSFYAGQLLRDQGATLIEFVGPTGRIIASAGDPRLTEAARHTVVERDDVRPACVGALPLGAPDDPSAAEWAPCAYPEGPAEGSLFQSDGDLYAVTTVPLRTEGRLDGGFVAVEPIAPAVIGRLSDLSGGRIHLGRVAEAGADLDTLVRSLPGIEVRVATTYDAERAIIRRARLNLVASGLFALVLALGASLLLARAFARPILRMREATRRLSEGHLEQRVEVDREDEIGKLGEAFNELASRLTASQERVRLAQRLARFGNWYLDIATRRFEGTAECRRLLAIDEPGPVDEERFLAGVAADDRAALSGALAEAIGRGTPFRLDVQVSTPDDGRRILHVRCHPRPEEPSRVEGSIQDVTDRRTAEEEIRFLSLHDPLTGLGNRDRALAALRARVDDAGPGTPFAVLVLGVGDLRGVADTFGHAVGDTVLVEVAGRLLIAVREGLHGAGKEAELVTRLGDDRFALIVDHLDGRDDAVALARRVLSAVREPFHVPSEEISLVPSLGITLWPEDGASAETLLRNGEAALSRAQLEEPGAIRFFHSSMLQDASRRLRIANLLRRAVAEEALELYYQPRIDARSGALIGFEALARWSDLELGPVSPAEFIPIAEATGTIHALGRWSIQTAARQLRAWHEAGHRDLSVSVNLSHHQLRPDLIPIVLECTAGLEPSRFELEVTESGLIEEGDAALETLTTLRGHGYRIALDDFGTGYSSLSYLQGIPIDTVKLDRAFIREVAEDEDSAALTGSVLAMCRALRLHAVAEGVETAAQLEVLVNLECPEVQGYLFSMPLPALEATQYLGRVGADRPRDLPI